ncbi:ricin-type beta-trefoil lectin domain protein [Streptomyces clavifer]
MTRSSQQPPASPRAHTEPASEGEKTGAGNAPDATTQPTTTQPTTAERPTVTAEPESEPAEAQTRARKAGAEAPESEKAPGASGSGPAEGSTTTEPGTSAGAVHAEPEAASGEPTASAGAPSDPDADPGAAAAAQSRLPAFVRTMTATAIGKPEQEAGPVGRPGRAVLAGAAVAGALLVSVPFLILVGNDDKGPEQPSVAAAGTVLDGSGQEAPGDFAVTPAETSSAPSVDKKKNTDTPVPEKAAQKVPAPDTAKDVPKKSAEQEGRPKKETTEKESAAKKSDVAKKQPAKAAPAVTFSGPVSFRSHLSGRCIDVPGHDFSDGKALHVWDCNGAPAQKWQFASDGTIRIQGKCLDVANANFSNGTPIQIAWCNGNAAQKFALNGSHDLVNTVVGMCVDIAGANRNSGAALQLLTCTGNAAQKWST